MQEDPLTGLDLTSDPSQADPTPAAKVAKISKRSFRAAHELDLSAEVPSERGAVVHTVYTERSTLAFLLSFWPPRARFQFHVEGHLSWAAPFAAAVLLLSIAAGVAVPTIALGPDSSREVWFLVAGIAAGSVLVAGVLSLLILLFKRRPSI